MIAERDGVGLCDMALFVICQIFFFSGSGVYLCDAAVRRIVEHKRGRRMCVRAQHENDWCNHHEMWSVLASVIALSSNVTRWYFNGRCLLALRLVVHFSPCCILSHDHMTTPRNRRMHSLSNAHIGV